MVVRAATLIVTMFGAAAPVFASTPAPPMRPAQRTLLIWTPGETRCDGRSAAPVAMMRPQPGLGWAAPMMAPQPIALRFRIDVNGRPLSIAMDGNGYRAGTTDVAPSLAASRFAAGAPRTGCTISYSLRVSTLSDSAPADLAAYGMAASDGPLPIEGWQRIRPTARDCLATPRPAPLLRAFPDFNRIAARPGVRDWSMIGYDLDAHGRPVHAGVTFGSGNAALDAAAIKAVRASRFAEGTRTGCVYPYWRSAATLAAPPSPDLSTLRPADAQCANAGDWVSPLALIYPQPYRRRGIEGWAVVGFDVAPWGETGNVHVLASEPTAAFGEQAMQMLRGARKAASPTGRSGCVELVRFLMVGAARDGEPATG